MSAPCVVPALHGDRLAALARHLEQAAREVGRFRRRVQADPELDRLRYLADRLARDLEWSLWMLQPTAGELVAWSFPGDDETAAAALKVVDARADAIRRLLGDRSEW